MGGRVGIMPSPKYIFDVAFEMIDYAFDFGDRVAYKGFFGQLKTEFFYPLNWQVFTIDQFI